MNRPKYKELFNEEYRKKIEYQSFLLQTIKFIKDNDLVDYIVTKPDNFSFNYILAMVYNKTFLCMCLDEDLSEKLELIIGDKDNK